MKFSEVFCFSAKLMSTIQPGVRAALLFDYISTKPTSSQYDANVKNVNRVLCVFGNPQEDFGNQRVSANRDWSGIDRRSHEVFKSQEARICSFRYTTPDKRLL